jgi:hypothetical protein
VKISIRYVRVCPHPPPCLKALGDGMMQVFSFFLHAAPPFHLMETTPLIPFPLSYTKIPLFLLLNPHVLLVFFLTRAQEPKSSNQNSQ